MHLHQILAIARKDARDIIANRATLMILLVPIFIAVLYYILSRLLISSAPDKIMIYDPGHSNIGKTVQTLIQKAEIVAVQSPEDVISTFGVDGTQKESAYSVGIIVGANFNQQIQEGKQPEIKLYINGKKINQQQAIAIQSTLTSYAYTIASPLPIVIQQNTINPPDTNAFQVEDIDKMWLVVALAVSLMIGMAVIPTLIVEEKEKHTIRVLLVSPASYADMILAKLVVGMCYQLVVSLIIVIMMSNWQFGIVLQIFPMVILGNLLSITIGILLGSLLPSITAVNSISGVLIIPFILPAMFAGPMGALLLGSGNLLSTILQILPTYYFAHGTYAILLHSISINQMLMDVGISVATIVVGLLIATWALRQQASKLATL